MRAVWPRSKSRRKRVVGAALAFFVACGGAAVVQALPSAKYGLAYSTTADMASPIKLSHANVSGSIYVFVINSTGTIAKVSFYLDDPSGNAAPIAVADAAPFVMKPSGAATLDTSTLSAGIHTVLAQITSTTNKSSDLFGRFLVASGGTTTPTTKTPTGTGTTATTAPATSVTTAPATTSPTTPVATPATASQCTKTAAQTLNWGAPTYQSTFDGSTLDPTWHPYGPESGHGGAGTRTPAAITESGGAAKISSDGNGTTGAMKWFPGQKYGRWEVCMKSETGKQHYVAILWPDAEDFDGGGGEIDFVEENGGTGSQAFFLHCGTDEPNCQSGETSQDASQWTAWAVEWTPNNITAYVNGEQWFTTTDSSQLPPRSMDLCLQLDYFGDSGADSMTIDDASQWAIPESVPGTLGLKPGESSTGHPEESPDKAPRAMTTAEMLGG